MAAHGYEISLLVFLQHEKRNVVSPSMQPCNVVLKLLCKTNEIPKYFNILCCERCEMLCKDGNSDLFMCEDTMLFSRVTISCYFHV